MPSTVAAIIPGAGETWTCAVVHALWRENGGLLMTASGVEAAAAIQKVRATRADLVLVEVPCGPGRGPDAISAREEALAAAARDAGLTVEVVPERCWPSQVLTNVSGSSPRARVRRASADLAEELLGEDSQAVTGDVALAIGLALWGVRRDFGREVAA